MLHKICYLVLVAALGGLASGCMKIKKKGSDETPEPTQRSLPAVAELKVVPSEDLSNVQFFWPTDVETDFKIEVTAEKSKSKWTDFSRSTPVWTFRFPEAEDIYQIKVFSNSIKQFGSNENLVAGADVAPLAVIRLASPLKIKAQTDLNLKDFLGSFEHIPFVLIEELEIQSEKKLFIENFSKQIIIKNLFSNFGTIQTFSSAQKAVWPNLARDVGAFQLEVINGQGHLKLNVFAENGADGAAGPASDEKLTGMKGSRGAPAVFEKVPQGFCPRGGICGLGENYKCVKSPGRGERGGKALQGYTGANGLSGGSVWPYQVVVKNSNLIIEKNSAAGVGGRGGPGGNGGLGGPGGDGGDGNKTDLFLFLKFNPSDTNHQAQMRFKAVSEPCVPAEKGERGQDGDTGREGQAGPSGKILN